MAKEATRTVMQRIRRILQAASVRFRLFYLLIAFAALVIISSILSPDFFTPNNLINLSVRTAFLLVLSCGMTFVIVSGGIDLSVAAVAVLSHVIVAIILRDFGLSAAGFAITAGILSGLAVGVVNGWVISRLRINSFIVTMGMMVIARSLAEIVGKQIVTGVPPEFSQVLGNGKIWIFPIIAAIAIATAGISHVILSRTMFGMRARGVGANEEAADYLGISVKNIRLAIFAISGVLAGLTGVMLVGRLGAANPGILVGFELDAIAAPVIGGASFSGGEGSILGAFIGTLIIGIIANMLILLGVETYYEQVVFGLIILGAVFLAYSGRRNS